MSVEKEIKDVAVTKISTRGQTQVPAAVMRILGLAPEDRIVWTKVGDVVVVRKCFWQVA